MPYFYRQLWFAGVMGHCLAHRWARKKQTGRNSKTVAAGEGSAAY